MPVPQEECDACAAELDEMKLEGLMESYLKWAETCREEGEFHRLSRRGAFFQGHLIGVISERMRARKEEEKS